MPVGFRGRRRAALSEWKRSWVVRVVVGCQFWMSALGVSVMGACRHRRVALSDWKRRFRGSSGGATVRMSMEATVVSVALRSRQPGRFPGHPKIGRKIGRKIPLNCGFLRPGRFHRASKGFFTSICSTSPDCRSWRAPFFRVGKLDFDVPLCETGCPPVSIFFSERLGCQRW